MFNYGISLVWKTAESINYTNFLLPSAHYLLGFLYSCSMLRQDRYTGLYNMNILTIMRRSAPRCHEECANTTDLIRCTYFMLAQALTQVSVFHCLTQLQQLLSYKQVTITTNHWRLFPYLYRKQKPQTIALQSRFSGNISVDRRAIIMCDFWSSQISA